MSSNFIYTYCPPPQDVEPSLALKVKQRKSSSMSKAFFFVFFNQKILPHLCGGQQGFHAQMHFTWHLHTRQISKSVLCVCVYTVDVSDRNPESEGPGPGAAPRPDQAPFHHQHR